ncbi:MAG: hypothetical protein U0228_07505 [Myxococcaceae bacterium]
MNAGDVAALDFSVLYREVSAPLRKKHGLAWCLGPAGTNAAGTPLVRCAVADVLFDERPTLERVQRLELKVREFTQFRAPGVYLLKDEPLPRGVTLLGTLAKRPRVSKRAATFVTYAGWSNFVIAFEVSWRREHEAPVAAPKVAPKPRARSLADVRLAPALPKLVSKRRATAVQALLREGVRALSAAKTRKARLTALEGVVEQLNAYDEAQGGFIDTAERETLLECLEALAAVSGLGDVSAKLDAWREW